MGKGVPFRECHEIVGKTVAYAITNQKDLEDLSLDELQGFSDLIEEDAYQVLTLEGISKCA